MTEVLNVTEARRDFSQLVERVGRGEGILVTRRGKPVMALVPPVAEAATQPAVLGRAAFVGALSYWEELDDVVEGLYASRRRARDRPAPSFD